MTTYKDNAELYEQVEDIPGEQAMFAKATEIIKAYANQVRASNNRGISILDLCCGTMAIVRSLPLDENDLIARITGVDISQEYLDFAEKKCDDVTLDAHVQYHGCGADTRFVKADAVEYTHPEQVDVIIASSAYHHIEDERKLNFLRKVHTQLKDDGIAVLCENLIGNYQNLAERAIAVTDFYAERIKQMARMGISDRRLGLLCRVLQYELDREYEWKHSYSTFVENLEQTGFRIEEEHKVWPNEPLFLEGKMGDFVLVVRKK